MVSFSKTESQEDKVLRGSLEVVGKIIGHVWHQPLRVNLETFQNCLSRRILQREILENWNTPLAISDNLFMVPFSKSKSQQDRILGGSFEVVFIAIWACPPALSENPCLISALKKTSQPQVTQVLLSRIMCRRQSLKTCSQPYSSNDTSPNVFYATFWHIIIPRRFSLYFLVFFRSSCEVPTRVLLCVRMCQDIESCL